MENTQDIISYINNLPEIFTKLEQGDNCTRWKFKGRCEDPNLPFDTNFTIRFNKFDNTLDLYHAPHGNEIRILVIKKLSELFNFINAVGTKIN